MQENSVGQQGIATSNSDGVKSCMKENKLIPVIIALAVLLAVSISVMVWSLIQVHGKDEKIDSLMVKLAENDIKIDEEKEVEPNQSNDPDEALQNVNEEVSVKPAETSSALGSDKDGQGPYIKDGYFYVPEWGVKYRLSDELTDYGYAVAQDSLSNSFGKYEIGMTAVDKGDLISHPQARYYDDIFTCSAVMVTRTDQDLSNLFGPKKIVNAGGTKYVIYDYGAHDSCDFEDKTSKVIDQLVNIFSNPERI